jgi:prophage regulatory protein
LRHVQQGPATAECESWRPSNLDRSNLCTQQIADALLRLPAVQALTGLSKTTIYTLTARGAFPAPIRRGARCTRWKAGDVTAWLQAQGR